jgi:Xaa-Pro aminopeptidase
MTDTASAEPAGGGDAIDFARMIEDRIGKVRAAMDDAGVDLVVCTGQNNVSYLTGARVPAADAARASSWRSVATLRVDESRVRLHTQFPEGVPAAGAAHVVVDDWLSVETDEGASALVAQLPAGTIAIDDAPFPLWSALAGREVCDASAVMTPAKLVKSDDELRCIATAQAINEQAIGWVRPLAQPGVRVATLSGAFLDAVAQRGATANTVDPVFQVVPRSAEGEVVFPAPVRSVELQRGDVIWVDTGINYAGYASDFGATWFVGRAPDATERDQFARWRGVVDRVLAAVRPGATGADLVRAAGTDRGRIPWLSYFYLVHGIGTDSAEMPFIGTDLGPDFDASIVLQAGMVLVLEPVIWDDGHAGHRSEEIVAVTADGFRRLSAPAQLDEAGAWFG